MLLPVAQDQEPCAIDKALKMGGKGLTLCMHAALCSLRMSYVYRLQSSFATVKLNASMGFHAMLLHLVCKAQRISQLQLQEYTHLC